MQNLNPLNDIRLKILENIKPLDSENTKIQQVINDLKNCIISWNSLHRNIPIELIQAEGSTGVKQTHLKNASDIDLFVYLNPKKYEEILNPIVKNVQKKEKLEKLFKDYCREWIIPALTDFGCKNITLSYAEHPYVSVIYENYEIDVVFAFLLSQENLNKLGPITAVDRTFHHSKFIRDNLSETQRDDVRILKKFFKTHLSYGDRAQTGRGGFIGYAAELMIYHYKDVWNVFRHFSELPNTVIDIYNRKEKELRNQTRFINDFLLIMDPTDQKRNVAASISPRSWIYCNHKIREFLETTNIDLFFDSSLKLTEFFDSSIDEKIMVAEFRQINNDHYTKIRDKLYSLAENIKNLAIYDKNQYPQFQDVDYAIYYNAERKIYALSFYTSTPLLDKEYERKGPKINDKDHFDKFTSLHPDHYLKDGYAWVIEKRDLIQFDMFFRNQISVPKELELINISNPNNCKELEGKWAVIILIKCILPFSQDLKKLVDQKILIKKKRERA